MSSSESDELEGRVGEYRSRSEVSAGDCCGLAGRNLSCVGVVDLLRDGTATFSNGVASRGAAGGVFQTLSRSIGIFGLGKACPGSDGSHEVGRSSNFFWFAGTCRRP
jgi:hypothetical protein